MFLTLAVLAVAADPKPTYPIFVAHTSAGVAPFGLVAKVDAGFAVTLAEPAGTVPAGDLIALRRADVPLPPHPVAAHVRLANGDVFRTRALSGDDDLTVSLAVALGTADPQPLALPVTTLSAVWLVEPPPGTPADPARYSWVDSTKKADTLLLRNGDVVRGTFERFTGGADKGVVRFKAAGEATATSYARPAVAALALDPSLTRVKKPKAAFARLVTSDGSRVSVSSVTADSRTVDATTLTGGKLRLSLADVIAVDVFQGKATYLSDLKPKAVKEEPFGAITWPWAADRSVKGNPLRLKTPLGEEVFDKGLGLHSKTTLTYTLGGKYRRFEATVGLDAATGRKGAVDVRVLVDGTEQKIDGLTNLTAAGVRVLSVDVTKAKELTLVVDFGPGGDVQDDVTFADARLVE